MSYKYLLSFVKNRGTPPTSFLDTLIAWAKTADDEIFAPNNERDDVMPLLKPFLGPWTDPLSRKCAMLELLRVLAGFESSWHWNEGVDLTNARSQSDAKCEETGIFQVSYDSVAHSDDLRAFLISNGIQNPHQFIVAMKKDHFLAIEYCARLLRVSYKWDGPIKRGEINSSLSRNAMAEFRMILTNLAK